MISLRGAWALISLLGIGLLLRAQLVVGAESADASNLYTDHLRHMGEAMILVDHGFALYREPYGTLIAHEPNVGAEHAVLFPERTAPYPPLSILVHWPWAQLEGSGVLSPSTAHQGVVWMWTVVALIAALAVVRLFAPLPEIAQLWAGALAIPLLVGMGINGFFDCAYLFAGIAACLFWRRQQPAAALGFLGLAAALHFRAAVFAPLGLVIVWEQRKNSRALALGALSGLGVIPSAIAAVMLAGSLGTIPADNPVHYSHLKLALSLLVLLTAAAAVWLWRQQERLVAATVVVAAVLAILERSHGWWHAGTLLAPGLILAARPARVGWQWPVLLVWTIGSGYLAFRHPWSPFWEWVRFGLAAK